MKFPLINRTHYSIHRAFSKPTELAKAAKAAGYTHCGICDYGNISGAVEFFEACKQQKVLPVIGCDLGSTKVFALNKAGWNELIKIVTSVSCDGFLNRDSLDSSNLILVNEDLHDCRYIGKHDSDMYALTRALGEKIKVADLNEPVEGFHFASNEELPDSPVYSTIVERSSTYTILGAPRLPHFDSGKTSEIDTLKRLVEYGFKHKLGSIDPDLVRTYRDRVTYEMKVIELAELAGYFLIVADFVGKARKDQQLCSIGRGCFKYAAIYTNRGILDISQVMIGDLVNSDDGSLNAVTNVLKYDSYEELVEIHANGCKLAATKDHKILTVKKKYEHHEMMQYLQYWEESQNLEVGDFICSEKRTKDGLTTQDFHKITYIGIDYAKGSVYDLTVENRQNYLTTCGIVHNSAAGSLVSYLTGINLIDPIPYGLLFSRFFNAARAYPKHLSFDEYKFVDEWRDFESKLSSTTK